MRAIVEETEAALPPGAWPAWTGSNHDMFRFPTRWAEDDPAKVRLALLMLLSLRGTPVLYQGDEIGMANVAVAHEDMRDPLGVRFYPYYEGRDAGRTPMQWSDRPRRRLHRCRPTVAPARRPGRRQRGGRNGTTRVRSWCCATTSSPSGGAIRSSALVRHDHGADAASRYGPGRGVSVTWSRSTCRRRTSSSPTLPAPFRSAPTAREISRASRADLRLAPFEGVILERP